MKANFLLSAIVLSNICIVACNSDLKRNNHNREDNTEITGDDVKLTKNEASMGQWQLVWNDEFEGIAIDTQKWRHEINCYGGGNDEKQCYTARSNNSFVANGVLTIVARKEQYTGPAFFDDAIEYNANNTRTLPYTSARIRTKGLGDWTYGRFEIRAQLPEGQGTWPAIWMLPTDWDYGGWASSGEIDIMEAVNLKAKSDDENASVNELEARVHGTLHYGKTSPYNAYSGTSYKLPDSANPADGFHRYALEWERGEMRWYVDDVHYATQREDLWYTEYQDGNGNWLIGKDDAPFNKRFHLLINLAVGGKWPASVNDKGIDEAIVEERLLIDYVRVYQCVLSSETKTKTKTKTKSGKGCATISAGAELVTRRK